MLARKEGVDRQRGPAAGRDGLNHGGGPGDGVAAGEDAGRAGPEALLVGLDAVPFRELDRPECLVFDAQQVLVLADGRDDPVGREQRFAADHFDGPWPPRSVGLAQPHRDALKPRQLAAVDDGLFGRDKEAQLHAFLDGLLDLLVLGGHLRAGAAVQDDGLLRAATQGGPRRVYGGVAATDDGHDAVQGGRAVPLHALKEGDAGQYPFVALVLDPHALGHPGAQSQEDRPEAVLFKAVQREVLAQPLTRPRLDSAGKKEIYLLVQDTLRQAEIGDAVAKHAAQLGLLVEDRDGMALLP